LQKNTHHDAEQPENPQRPGAGATPSPSIHLARGLMIWENLPTLCKYLGQFSARHADSAVSLRMLLEVNEYAAASTLARNLVENANQLALTQVGLYASQVQWLLSHNRDAEAAVRSLELALHQTLHDIALLQADPKTFAHSQGLGDRV